MHRNRTVSLALAALLAFGLAPATGNPAAAKKGLSGPKPGLTQLLALPVTAAQRLIGIATFKGAPPSAAKATALRKLGLTVQPMKHLPLAIVYGTTRQMRNAVAKGLANDVYPNERLDWHSRESRAAVRADKVPLHITGKGVGVAILDSGIDATHPDLADHVTHNVKLVGPEYLGVTGMTVDPDMPPGTLVLPIDQLPYNNSDDSGHGTHVAGIVAADGTTTPDQLGMAPDAELIGYSTGDVLFIFTAVAAFDDILEHREEWNIDVVNNSWGSSFKVFDPDNPINVATRAVAAAGVVVTFSAGNSYDEMQMNPYSVPPWVISVGSGTTSGQRSDFSSGGLRFDNSLPMALPEDEHERFDGDRIGIYHPDVSAPGTNIVSSGTPTGTYVNLATVPPPPGGTATASGTSMAAPHAAGLAALLLQARPSLTPTQVREVMQVTSTRLRDNTPFWHAGYGYIDAQAAIALVLRKDFGPALLAQLQGQRDQWAQSERSFTVLSTDLWTFTPAFPATALGLESTSYEVEVTTATKAFNAAVAYSSIPAAGNLLGLFDWHMTVTDAAGQIVAESVVSEDTGLSRIFVDLVNPSEDADGNAVPPPKVTFGKWKIDVAGILWVRDPTDTLSNRQVSVSFSQLVPQVPDLSRIPKFVKAGDLSLYFQPDGNGGPATSPEGCAMQAGAPTGGMAATKNTAECQAGIVGYGTTYGAGTPAEFSSEPLKAAITIGGPALLTIYLVDEAQPVFGAYGSGVISYTLDAITQGGDTIGVAGGDMEDGAVVAPTPSKSEFPFVIPATEVPAGATLRLQLRFSCFCSSTQRMLFGGEFADSGLRSGFGSLKAGGASIGAPKPAPAPKPVVKGGPQLPATGVGGSALGYLLMLGASALALVSRRGRRARPTH
jgi:serine protease AprX